MHGWSNHKHIDNIAADSVWIETDLVTSSGAAPSSSFKVYSR